MCLYSSFGRVEFPIVLPSTWSSSTKRVHEGERERERARMRRIDQERKKTLANMESMDPKTGFIVYTRLMHTHITFHTRASLSLSLALYSSLKTCFCSPLYRDGRLAHGSISLAARVLYTNNIWMEKRKKWNDALEPRRRKKPVLPYYSLASVASPYSLFNRRIFYLFWPVFCPRNGGHVGQMKFQSLFFVRGGTFYDLSNYNFISVKNRPTFPI